MGDIFIQTPHRHTTKAKIIGAEAESQRESVPTAGFHTTSPYAWDSASVPSSMCFFKFYWRSMVFAHGMSFTSAERFCTILGLEH